MQEFKAWATNWYKLEGLVTLHHCGRELTNPYSTLGDVFSKSEAPLAIYFDQKFAVAVGGVAWAARQPPRRESGLLLKGGVPMAAGSTRRATCLGAGPLAGTGREALGMAAWLWEALHPLLMAVL